MVVLNPRPAGVWLVTRPADSLVSPLEISQTFVDMICVIKELILNNSISIYVSTSFHQSLPFNIYSDFHSDF